MLKDAAIVLGMVLAICAAGAALVAGGHVNTYVIGILATGAYLIPTWVAVGRSHHNTMAIALLNFFLGWTLLGWVGALVWSATAVRPASAPTPPPPSPAAAQTNPAAPLA